MMRTSSSRMGANVARLLPILIFAGFAIFMMIKGINRMKRKEAAKPNVPPAPPAEVVLLSEIRDLLKKS